LAETGTKVRGYRAAIIGCGRIGADCGSIIAGSSRIGSHAEAYRMCSSTELVAVCDPDTERLQRCGKRWQVSRLYRDHRELLATEEIDVVSICTPAATHFELLLEVLESRRMKGILLEKPLAVKLEHADAAIALAARSTAKVSVNYIRRFPPVYRQAAMEIRQGRLGNIHHVNILYTKGIVNNGTHAFDLLRFLIGELFQVSLLSRDYNGSSDPSLSVKVEFEQGFEAWLCGLPSDTYNVFEVDIMGSNGRMVFRDQGHILDKFSVEDTVRKHGFRLLKPDPDSYPTDLTKAVQYAVTDLIESIETNRQPACTLQDARAAMDLSFRLLQDMERVSIC